jgi:tetratricopeptide (TPR) repeat protein
VPPPGTAENYLKIATDYPGSKAAARAVIEAAGVYYVQGRYADAQKQFDRISKEYPGSPWQAEAAMGIAGALEAQGRTAEALAKYDETRRRYANSTVVDNAKLSMARLYEQQNKPAEALKLYEELVKLAQANPYSAIGNEAGMHMEELLKAHPELAKTNAPPPAVTQIPTPGAPNQTSVVRTINLSNMVQRPSTNMAGTNLMVAITNRPPATNAPTAATNRIAPTGNPTTSPAPAPAPPRNPPQNKTP